MELIFLLYPIMIAFGLGLIAGAGLFVLGFTLGRFTDSSTFRRKEVEVDEYDPTVLGEEYFERARLEPGEGGLEFPSDSQLEQLREHNS